MKRKIKSVCVYCGASQNVDPLYKHAIEDLARGLVDTGLSVVYGGGSAGTMGYLAKTAIKAGGSVIGIIPKHIIAREGQQTELTELHVVESMHNRKMMMVEKSDAFIAMPGGMGTLDELFEILTWKYLGLHDKPIVIGNINGYFTPLFDMLHHMIAEGYTPKHHLNLFKVADTIEDILCHVGECAVEESHIPRTEKM